MLFKGEKLQVLLKSSEEMTIFQREQSIASLERQFGHIDIDLNLENFGERIIARRTILTSAFTASGEFAGTGTYTFYHNDELREHLVLESEEKDGKTARVRLRSFKKILDEKGFYFRDLPCSVETDYMVVTLTGNGVARTILKSQLAEISARSDVAVVYGMPQGMYSPSPGVPNIFMHKIKGFLLTKGMEVWASAEECLESTRFDISLISKNSGRPQMTTLMEKFGFLWVCFNITSSPIWAIANEQLKGI